MRKIVVLMFLLQSVLLVAQDFTIMSYNIRCGQCDEKNSNNWEGRKNLVLATIKDANVDIIGFQEIIPLQLTWLAANLPDYNYYGSGRDADRLGEGCYIFYRKDAFVVDSTQSSTKWYSSTPNLAGSADMGDLYKRIVTYVRLKQIESNKSFYYYNTHLTYLPEIQEKYVDFLSNVIKSRELPEPFILSGDFNAEEQSTAINRLKINFAADTLVDSYRQVHLTDLISTFNDFTGIPKGMKIDYIFLGATSFTTLDATCINHIENGKYPSDHYPITARLKPRF